MSERRAGLEKGNVGADPPEARGRPSFLDVMSDVIQGSHRGTGVGMYARGNRMQHGKPHLAPERVRQPRAREGRLGPSGVAERPVVVMMPGNAGGAKGP